MAVRLFRFGKPYREKTTPTVKHLHLASEDIKRIARYLTVGGGTALLELVLFQVLYYLAGWDVAVANVCAVITATLCNFLLNRGFTFKSTANPVRSAVLYVILFAFNTCFSTTVIALLVAHAFNATLAKLITMACIVCWNYVMYHKVIFK